MKNNLPLVIAFQTAKLAIYLHHICRVTTKMNDKLNLNASEHLLILNQYRFTPLFVIILHYRCQCTCVKLDFHGPNKIKLIFIQLKTHRPVFVGGEVD